MVDRMDSLGRRIAAARQQAGLRQQDLAEQLQVAHCTVWRWEQDQQDPHPRHRAALDRLLAESGAPPCDET
jgi:transcriptional regulator with XRE-family HTH domain